MTPYLMNYKMVSDSSIKVPGSSYRPVISTPSYEEVLANWREEVAAGEERSRPMFSYQETAEKYLRIVGAPFPIDYDNANLKSHWIFLSKELLSTWIKN